MAADGGPGHGDNIGPSALRCRLPLSSCARDASQQLVAEVAQPVLEGPCSSGFVFGNDCVHLACCCHSGIDNRLLNTQERLDLDLERRVRVAWPALNEKKPFSTEVL